MIQYSYPSIYFNETIAGPVNQPTPFRNRIGVIGNFSKGTSAATPITTRKDFAFTYGLDNRLGSLGVQGIFSQNATNLLIKRVISNGTPASTKLLIKGPVEDQQPLVGYGRNGVEYITTIDGEVPLQTSGLQLGAEFIGKPISYTETGSKITLLRSETADKPNSTINPKLSLDGIGNISLKNEGYSRKVPSILVDGLTIATDLTWIIDAFSSNSNTYTLNQIIPLEDFFTDLNTYTYLTNLASYKLAQSPVILQFQIPVFGVTDNGSFKVLKAGTILQGDRITIKHTINASTYPISLNYLTSSTVLADVWLKSTSGLVNGGKYNFVSSTATSARVLYATTNSQFTFEVAGVVPKDSQMVRTIETTNLAAIPNVVQGTVITKAALSTSGTFTNLAYYQVLGATNLILQYRATTVPDFIVVGKVAPVTSSATIPIGARLIIVTRVDSTTFVTTRAYALGDTIPRTAFFTTIAGFVDKATYSFAFGTVRLEYSSTTDDFTVIKAGTVVRIPAVGTTPVVVDYLKRYFLVSGETYTTSSFALNEEISLNTLFTSVVPVGGVNPLTGLVNNRTYAFENGAAIVTYTAAAGGKFTVVQPGDIFTGDVMYPKVSVGPSFTKAVDAFGFVQKTYNIGDDNIDRTVLFETNDGLVENVNYYFQEGLPVLQYITGDKFIIVKGGIITEGDIMAASTTINLTNGTPINLYVGTKIELLSEVFFVLLEAVVATPTKTTIKGYLTKDTAGYSSTKAHDILFHLGDGKVELQFTKELVGSPTDFEWVSTNRTSILNQILPQNYVERYEAAENIYDSVQVITFKDIAGNEDLLRQIKPGLLVDSAEDNIYFSTLNDDNLIKNSLLVLSYPYKSSLSSDFYSVLVKGYIYTEVGTFPGATGATSVAVQLKANPKAYYTISSKTSISNGLSFSYIPELIKQQIPTVLDTDIIGTANLKLINNINITTKLKEGDIIAILPKTVANSNLTTKNSIYNAAIKTGRINKFVRPGTGLTISYTEQYTKPGTITFPEVGVEYTIYLLDTSNYTELNDIKYVYKDNVIFEQQLDSYTILDELHKVDNLVHTIYYRRNEDNTLYQIRSGLLFDVEKFLDTDSVALVDGVDVSVPFGKSNITIGDYIAGREKLTIGLSGLDLLNLLNFEIQNNPILNKILDIPVVTDNFSTINYDLTSLIQNESSNYVQVTINNKSSVENFIPEDILLVDPTYYTSVYSQVKTLKGGLDPASSAKIDLYSSSGIPLYTVVATSPGLSGNGLRITVIPGLNGEFSILVSDVIGTQLENQNYSEILRYSSKSINPNNLELVNVKGQVSKLIRVYSILGREKGLVNLTPVELNLVPNRIGPPFSNRISALAVPVNKVSGKGKEYNPYYQGETYLKDLALKGGDEKYVPTAENDPDAFVQAIQDMEFEDVAVVYLPGFDPFKTQNRKIVDIIVKQVTEATPYTGLRRYILQIPSGTGTGAIAELSNYINSPWVQLVKGKVSLSSIVGNNNIEVAALVAGLLGVLSPEIPIQSAGAGAVFAGVTSVDTLVRTNELEAITRANADMVYFDTGLNVFKLLNGLTTAISGLDRFVSVRRLSDQIQQDLYSNLLFARSRNNDPKLRAIVSSSVDAYFGTLLTKGQIASFSPTICNSSNNTIQDIAERRLNITVRYEVLLPADYIYVNIIREVVNTFSLNL